MYLVEKLEKVKRSPRVYGRVSKGVEGFSEGTWKEKGTEGEGEGVVILLMHRVMHPKAHYNGFQKKKKILRYNGAKQLN